MALGFIKLLIWQRVICTWYELFTTLARNGDGVTKAVRAHSEPGLSEEKGWGRRLRRRPPPRGSEKPWLAMRPDCFGDTVAVAY